MLSGHKTPQLGDMTNIRLLGDTFAFSWEAFFRITDIGEGLGFFAWSGSFLTCLSGAVDHRGVKRRLGGSRAADGKTDVGTGDLDRFRGLGGVL